MRSTTHPVNEFVAGFIGEPPMNFLPCKPQAEGDELRLHASDNSFQLALPNELRQRVLENNPTEVHLGIRPVHMQVAPTATNGDQADLTLRGDIYTYEDLGEEGQLAAYIGQQQVLAVVATGLELERGDAVSLQLRPDRIHLFDAKTQLAL